MARGQQKRAWQVATSLFGANVAIAAQLRNDLLKNPSKEKHRDRWTTNFSELRQWLQQHENVYPERGTQKGNKLEKWVRRQRVAFREDKLSQQKQLLLESLPAWTWGCWHSKFHALLLLLLLLLLPLLLLQCEISTSTSSAAPTTAAAAPTHTGQIMYT